MGDATEDYLALLREEARAAAERLAYSRALVAAAWRAQAEPAARGHAFRGTAAEAAAVLAAGYRRRYRRTRGELARDLLTATRPAGAAAWLRALAAVARGEA